MKRAGSIGRDAPVESTRRSAGALSKRVLLLFTASALLATPLSAFCDAVPEASEITHWKGAADTREDWGDPGFWSLGLPSDSVGASIDNQGIASILKGGHSAAGVEVGPSGAGTLVLDASVTEAALNVVDGYVLSIGGKGSGALLVEHGAQVQVPGEVRVAEGGGGSGRVELASGAALEAGRLSAALDVDSVATITVTGPETRLDLTGAASTLGHAGSATLKIRDDAVVSSQEPLILAVEASSSATLDLAASQSPRSSDLLRIPSIDIGAGSATLQVDVPPDASHVFDNPLAAGASSANDGGFKIVKNGAGRLEWRSRVFEYTDAKRPVDIEITAGELLFPFGFHDLGLRSTLTVHAQAVLGTRTAVLVVDSLRLEPESSAVLASDSRIDELHWGSRAVLEMQLFERREVPRVDQLLRSGTGPWLFKLTDHPTLGPPRPGARIPLLHIMESTQFEPADFSFSYSGEFEGELTGQFLMSDDVLFFELAPRLDLGSGRIDFGSVDACAAMPITDLSVGNDGSAALKVSAIEVVGPFVIEEETCLAQSLPPGGACVIRVSARPEPAMSGTETGELTVHSNAVPGTQRVELAIARVGSGAPRLSFLPASPAFDLGAPAIGESSGLLPMRIQNTGSGCLVVSECEVQGDRASSFALRRCFGKALAAGEVGHLLVECTPGDIGVEDAELVITSNDATAPQTIMGLFCEGGETFHSGFEVVPPPSVLTIDPAVLHLGEGNAAQIAVVRSGGDLEAALAVSLDAPAGVSVPDVIELEPGQPQVNVTIHSEDDTQASGNRQIGLTAAAQRHAPASASVVIEDDDAPALCGNGRLDPGEEVDPPVSSSDVVPVDPTTCRYDFSNVQQLYCGGDCGVAWNGQRGCQAGDADALCRLVTGNPLATVRDEGWNVQAAWYGSGFCCPGEGDRLGCTSIPGTLRGVPATQISVHSALRASHGPGAVVSIDGVESCEIPE